MSETTHHRRSIRLPSFDYTDYGAYFITIVTHDRRSLFGVISNDEMQLNDLGRIVETEWHNTAVVRHSILLDAFVIMPNHVHAIIWLDARAASVPNAGARPRRFGAMPARSRGAMVRGFKAAVTRAVRQLQQDPAFEVWQSNYHERVIRNERELDAIRQYVADNPKQWVLDREYVAEDRPL